MLTIIFVAEAGDASRRDSGSATLSITNEDYCYFIFREWVTVGTALQLIGRLVDMFRAQQKSR
jgi:hypothetical protein